MPTTDAIRIQVLLLRQPLGDFYAGVFPASLLLRVAYSSPLTATGPAAISSEYPLTGIQRRESEDRLKQIGRFIETADAAFPNAVVLAANYSKNGTRFEDDSKERWRVEIVNGRHELVIPTMAPAATIVDGQHRVHGFEYARADRRDMGLLCSVYLDLPVPFQAYLFATINSNQKKVDRSLAYLLFGFNVDEEPAEAWAPDKTAAFVCRKLNTEQESPFFSRIKVAAEDSERLFDESVATSERKVSTATVVDGILSLLSADSKRDRDELHKHGVNGGRRRMILRSIKDRSPLRNLYLDGNDLAI